MKHHPDTELIALYASIGKIITSSLNMQSVLNGIMDEIRLFFNPQNWSLFRYDSLKDELRFLIAEGIDFNTVKDLIIPGGQGIAGQVAKTGQAFFIPDTETGVSYLKDVDRLTGFKTKSIIAVPVCFKDRMHGVIEIINRQSGEPFTDEEHIILQTIADFAAIAFSNMELFNETLRLAHQDVLTGALNRTSLNEFLEECEAEPGKSRKLVIASIDFDKFKDINDSYGHLTGDKVLAFFASEIRSILPEDGRLFRIGGDEFLISVPVSDQNTEENLKEKLNNVSERCLSHQPPLSFSWGIMTGSGSQIRHLLYETDLLMYSQKKDGCNSESEKITL